METIEINGEKYRKVCNAGKKYVIVRTYSAGVHAGYYVGHNGEEVTLTDARRLWYWNGAASLSELSQEGTLKPEDCKFPCTVPKIILTNAIEIIDVSEKARKSIESVRVWSAKDE